MSNQLGVLQTLFPYDVLFPKNCDLSVKPPASCVPVSTPCGVSMLTSNRKTVAKVADDGNIQPSSSSAATSQMNSTSISTGINTAAVAGIVIGSFVFGILTFLVFLFWCHHRVAQDKSRGSNLYTRGKGSTGRMTQPMPWVDENVVVIENPSPALQGDGSPQTPPTRSDHSDTHSPEKQRQ